MHEVIADAIAAEGVVAPGVNGADVAGLQCVAVDLIELDEVVVASEEDRAVRVVMDKIVRGALANAADEHGGDIALGPAALARKVAILHKVPAGAKGLPVAAVHRDAAVARIEDVAAQDAVAGAVLNGDAVVADVADEAAGDAVARAAVDLDGAAARGFEDQAAEGDVGNVGEFEQRLGEEGKEDFGRGALRRLN